MYCEQQDRGQNITWSQRLLSVVQFSFMHLFFHENLIAVGDKADNACKTNECLVL